MKDIDMKVMPVFIEDESAIVFSFHFKDEQRKIGEAVIHTSAEGLNTRNMKELRARRIKGGKPPQKTVANLKQFTIVEEYKETSLEKIFQFLELIGVERCYLNEYYSYTSGEPWEE